MSQAGWLRRSRLGLMLVGAAGGSVLAAALLIGGFLVWRFVVDDAPADAGATPTPTLAHPSENRLVEIQLQGVPEGARLRLGGQPVSGNSIQKPVGTSAILEVVAPGFHPLHVNLTFQANSVVDLTSSLQPQRTPDAGPAAHNAATTPAEAPEGTPAPRPQLRENRGQGDGARAKTPSLPPVEIANPWGS